MPLFFILYKADLPTHEFHQKRSPTIHPYSYTFYEDKHIKTKYYVIMGKWFKNMNNEYCHITIIVDVKQECVCKGWKWKAVNAVLRKYNFFCVKRFTEEKSLKLSSKTLFDLYAYSIVSNTYQPTLCCSTQFNLQK